VKSEFPVVGIIGAEENVRMMIASATALGIKLLPFTSDTSDSAAQVIPCVIGDYTDIEAIKKFAEQCDVVTFEHHLVPLSIIKALEVAGVKVRPGSQTLEYSREKLSRKESIDFDYIINVQVARSPHAQATTWAPTQVLKSDGKCMMTISPAPLLSAAMSEKEKKMAEEKKLFQKANSNMLDEETSKIMVHYIRVNRVLNQILLDRKLSEIERQVL
jgi:phosphoribosylaminoimidazole carboxylase (NCAIR synthetase)